ncbi:MAG: DNA recombination protein RmuC [Candidatus Magasanikbacteria bacterium]|jgi:DNA recombination protein RmuC|nr:DNA recombination protein RmuC [Candidatus Magasanikbacteria bacterium]
MENFIILLLLAIIAALAAFLFKISKKIETIDSGPDKNLFLMLQNMIQDQSKSVQVLAQTVDKKITQSEKSMGESQRHLHQTIQEQFSQNTRVIQGITGQSAKMIGEITEKLTSLDKTNQQVISFSEQLNNLEKILTSQKQRGNLGEAGLQLVLENILPPTAFTLQHAFPDGDIVDAVIHMKDGIIPIDAKFPLDNYSRLVHETDNARKKELEKAFKQDLKKRIDETSKYIKPKDGTMEFAFMFIPSEAIYYDLLVNEVGAVTVNTRNLIDYAFAEKRVIIVSPTTFAAYLQTVLQGLRALKIEEGAKAIRKNVERLQKHLKAYEQFMTKLGGSLGTSVNHYNTAYKELAKIDKDVVRITQGERQIEAEAIDRPQMEDLSLDR